MSALRSIRGLLIAGAVVGAVSSQPIAIPGTVACSSCRIVVTKVATLGSANDPVDIGASIIARNSRGEFYAIVARLMQIAVYDAKGSFVTTMGRAGQGPGEFRSIRGLVVGRADTVFVQSSLTQVSVFSPQRVFVREFPIPSGHELKAALRDGHLVFRAAPDPRGPGVMPAMITSTTGTILTTFGASDSLRSAPARCSTCDYFVLTAGKDANTVWVTPSNRYEVTQWRAEGTREKVFSVTGSPWFKEWGAAVQTSNALAQPPRTVIHHVHEDSTGRLWIAGSVPNANWKPYSGPVSGTITSQGAGILYPGMGINETERAYINGDARKLVSTVDVIDPATRRILAHTRIESGELFWLSNELAYTVWRDADNLLHPDILRICLVENSASRTC